MKRSTFTEEQIAYALRHTRSTYASPTCRLPPLRGRMGVEPPCTLCAWTYRASLRPLGL